MKRVACVLALSAYVVGCAANTTRTAPATPAAAVPATTAATSSASAAAPSAFPEAVRAFEAERVSGAMALFDSQGGKLLCSDPERCARGYIPASTFKIANTVIALETGLVSDPESPLPWDGKDHEVKAWNRDHTLRSAIQVSCVPCFQGIARQVGAQRMQGWLTRLHYGNQDSSGQIDFFWLGGALRISPLEQIDFLRRLDSGKLPIQEHTLDVVREVLTLDVGADYVLRGKTGYSAPPEQPSEVGWFVGFVELGERRVFFATVIDAREPGVDIVPVRRRLTERALRELGVLPI